MVTSFQVCGAARVLAHVLAGNAVCQEIAVATPLELHTTEAPPEYFLRSLLRAACSSPPGGGGIDPRAQVRV